MQRCGVHVWPAGNEFLPYDRDQLVKHALRCCLDLGFLADGREMLRMMFFGGNGRNMPGGLPVNVVYSRRENLSMAMCCYGVYLRGSDTHTLKRMQLGCEKFMPFKVENGRHAVVVSCCFLVRYSNGDLEELIIDDVRQRVYVLRYTHLDMAVRVLFGGEKTPVGDSSQLQFSVNYDDDDGDKLATGLRVLSSNLSMEYATMMGLVTSRFRDLTDIRPESALDRSVRCLLADGRMSVENAPGLLLVLSESTDPMTVVERVASVLVNKLSRRELSRLDILAWSMDVCYLNTLRENLNRYEKVGHLMLLQPGGDNVAISSFIFSRRSVVTDRYHNRLQTTGFRQTANDLMEYYSHALILGDCPLFDHVPSARRLTFALRPPPPT